jgi:glutamate-1-semialdehyde aminotransferase
MGTSSEFLKSKKRWKETLKYISSGVQTLSKQPDKFVFGQYPIYLERGQGAYVYDEHDSKFIDYPLGLGAILLGHSYPDIKQAIAYQLDRGTLFTLPSFLETELAKKLNKLIPCAEKVRFLKTGSEADSAAIKIGRAYTGKDHIAYCGYHGWHDWYTVDTQKNLGIPKEQKNLIHKFEYNNIESLVDILKNYDVGVVILEPYIYDLPQNMFLHQLVGAAHKYGAIVVFDEVVTGFRTKDFSAQKYFKVTPDLSCFGKAMANGLPISVVCGKKEIMKVLEGDCFVSSTFGGELLSIVSTLATIKVLEDEKAIDSIWNYGTMLKDGYNDIASDLELDTSSVGCPSRTMYKFPSGDHKSLFWQECIKRGVLFGYAQFISYSHREEEILYTLDVVKEALKVVKKNWKNPLRALRGKAAKEVFRMVCTKEQKLVKH